MGSRNASDTKSRFRNMISALLPHWPLLSLIFCFLVAWSDPKPGAAAYSIAMKIVVPVIFFQMGLTIDINNLFSIWENVGVLAFCPVYSLVVLPFIYYICIFYWGWEVSSGIIHKDLAPGIMACMCMPTTTNTGILFTCEANGDYMMATMISKVGQLLGTVVAPLMAELLLGEGGTNHMVSRLLKLFLNITVPLCAGLTIQYFITINSRIKTWLKIGTRLLLVGMFYFLFCKVFHSGMHGLSSKKFCILTAYIAVLYLLASAGAWMVGAVYPIKQRICIFFMAPQKSEGMAVPILSSIFNTDDVGLYILPVVIYHTIQLAIASFATSYLRSLVHEDEKSESNEALVDAAIQGSLQAQDFESESQ